MLPRHCGMLMDRPETSSLVSENILKSLINATALSFGRWELSERTLYVCMCAMMCSSNRAVAMAKICLNKYPLPVV
jgi:hypothetical protein